MRNAKKIIMCSLLMSFTLCNAGYCVDKKEEAKQYIAKVNPILIDVQMLARNISQKFWSPDTASKHMQVYINNLRSLVPPEYMAKQHRMILLSFQKLKAGFYELSKGNRPLSIALVKRGGELLRIAVKDIVDFAKKEGLVKEKGKNQ